MLKFALLSLLAAVELGGAFGSATASTVSISQTTMVVDLEVEVTVSAESVVAHVSMDEEVSVIPMLSRGAGVYGTRTEMPLANHIVVFEVLGPEGALSDPYTLSQLGADTSLPPDDEGETPEKTEESTQWGWLALALGAASLSLLAFWALGGRDDGEPEGEENQDEPAATEEE